MTITAYSFRAPARGGTGQAGTILKIGFRTAAVLALMMGLIAYSGAWFWPTDGLNDFFSIKAIGGAPFRAMLWGVICTLFLGALAYSNRSALPRALAPYLGLLGVAAVSSLFGDNPASSLRYLTLWAMMITSGAAIGVILPPIRINLAACIMFAAVPFISFALLVIHPSWALMHFAGKFAVRGLFQHKNTAGAFAAYGALFSISFRTRLRPLWRNTALALSLALLALTFSATALGGFLIGLMAFFGIGALQRARGPRSVKLLLLLVAVGLVAAIVDGVLPLVVDALGKGQSISGRTAGWAFYWRFFQGHLMFGRGPGAFVTGASQINEMISRLLTNDVNKSTHNAYLAILGEVGLAGLAVYVLGLGYILVVAPFRPSANSADLTAAVIAAYVLASSFTEAKETLSPGVGTFLILICRGVAEAQRWSRRVELRRAALQQGRWPSARPGGRGAPA
jgi:O-antigen ligase